MTIQTRESVLPLVEREQEELIRRFPQHAQAIRDVVDEFRILYEDKIFVDFPELAAFCREVDQMDGIRSLPQELTDAVKECRRRILAQLSRTYFGEQNVTTGDIDPDRLIRLGERWGRRRRGRRLTPLQVNERLRGVVEEYLSLASHVGESETVQIMISVGVIREEDAPGALSMLRAYLGRCRRAPGGGGGGLLTLNPEILQFQSVRRIMHRMCRQQIYDTLLALGGDTMDRHELVRSRAGEEAQAVMENLARRANIDPKKHENLFREIRTYFQQAARLPIPQCFVPTLTHQGVEYPLPSWRQRLGITEVLRQRHVLIGLEPGLGKTFIPVLLYQLLRQRRLAERKGPGRLLYIEPVGILKNGDHPNQIRPGIVPGQPAQSYYDHEHHAQDVPTVGIIEDKMTAAEILQTCRENNIVYCPYSKLHLEKDETTVSDLLVNFRDAATGDGFTSVVFDECHHLKGNGTWTQCARDIIHRTPGLYQNGHVIFMSGTPATNTLADLRIIAELLEEGGREHQPRRRRRQSAQRTGPTLLRNMLERLVILDPPEDWERHVIPFPYQLSRDETRFLNAIVNDSTMHAKDKMDLMLRSIRSTDNLLHNTTHLLDMYLNERHTILIAENIHAQGTTREWDRQQGKDEDEEEQQPSDPIFRDRIIAHLQQWSEQTGIPVHFHVIDGKNNRTLRQREAVFGQARESDSTGTSKTVILAHSSCLREGIDLRFIRRMISLQWPFNSPDLQQLLKRSLRAGNTDIQMVVFFAQETLEQGIYEYAGDKYAEIRACLYGGRGFSDRRLRRLSQDEQEMSNVLRLLERVQSVEQREELIARLLHSRGMKYYRRFWSRNRNRQWFREQVERAETSGTGDADRYTGALIAELERSGLLEPGQYLNVHSHALRLDRMLQRIAPNEQRQVLSMDPLDTMLEDGRAAHLREGRGGNPSVLRGGLTHLIGLVHRGQLRRESFNAVVLNDLECTHMTSTSNGSARFQERLRALAGALRALRVGGTLVITLPRDACTREEFEQFCSVALPHFGCEVVQNWAGEGRSSDNEGDAPFRMFTVVARKAADVGRAELQNVPTASLQFTHKSAWSESREKSLLDGEERRRRLPYSLVHTEFTLGRHSFGTNLPSQTRAQQLTHLQALREAAKTVRGLAATRQEFIQLQQNTKTSLNQRGVEYLPQLPRTRTRPVFRLLAYPDYLFYPYDEQWNDS